MSKNWDDDKKNHSLEQLKYLLSDWIKTNNPNLEYNQNKFDNTCKCILDNVVIPNYEYKDGIEYIEWTSQDNEKIVACIDNILDKKNVNHELMTKPKEFNNDKQKSNQQNYILYIIIVILLILIIGFIIYTFMNSKDTNELCNLE